MTAICLGDQEAIQKAKEKFNNERKLLRELLAKDPEQNKVEELIEVLALENLINFLDDHYNNEYSYGYRIGINTAKSLSKLHSHLIPFKSFLVEEREKFSQEGHINLDRKEISLSQASLIVEDILQLISKILISDSFEFSQTVNGKIFLLKQNASTIPNPHDIPKHYSSLVNKNSKEAYKAYADFLHYLAGNWEIALKILRQIKTKLDDLHKICPFIRFSMVYGLLAQMNLDKIELLAPDLINSLVVLDLQDIILSHKEHLVSLISAGVTDPATITNLAQKLKQLVELLTNPLKNVTQLAIIMEQTIKIMLMMRGIQTLGHLSEEQETILNKMEKFFKEILEKQSIQVKEIVSISYKIVTSTLHELKSQEASRSETAGVSMTSF
jgi:hypothetical protein